MNVLLIVCDALRFDHFNSSNMPQLSKLSQLGTNFTRCFSIGGNTPLSMPGIFCSQKIYDKEQNFPTILRNHGYSTGMIQTNPLLKDYSHGFSKVIITYNQATRQNVRRFLDRRKLLRPIRFFLKKLNKVVSTKAEGGKDIMPYRRAKNLLQKTEIQLENLKQPWCFWTQLMDPHIPYMPLDYNEFTWSEMRELNDKILDSLFRGYTITEQENERIRRLYRAEVKYMDEWLGKFLVSIFKKYPKSLIIITSDHGDEFGEYGWYSHSPGVHGPTPQLLHVPLIIFGLGLNEGIVSEYVSHLDIVPTIFDYVGVNHKIGYGRSLRRYIS